MVDTGTSRRAVVVASSVGPCAGRCSTQPAPSTSLVLAAKGDVAQFIVERMTDPLAVMIAYCLMVQAVLG